MNTPKDEIHIQCIRTETSSLKTIQIFTDEQLISIDKDNVHIHNSKDNEYVTMGTKEFMAIAETILPFFGELRQALQTKDYMN